MSQVNRLTATPSAIWLFVKLPVTLPPLAAAAYAAAQGPLKPVVAVTHLSCAVPVESVTNAVPQRHGSGLSLRSAASEKEASALAMEVLQAWPWRQYSRVWQDATEAAGNPSQPKLATEVPWPVGEVLKQSPAVTPWSSQVRQATVSLPMEAEPPVPVVPPVLTPPVPVEPATPVPAVPPVLTPPVPVEPAKPVPAVPPVLTPPVPVPPVPVPPVPVPPVPVPPVPVVVVPTQMIVNVAVVEQEV